MRVGINMHQPFVLRRLLVSTSFHCPSAFRSVMEILSDNNGQIYIPSPLLEQLGKETRLIPRQLKEFWLLF